MSFLVKDYGSNIPFDSALDFSIMLAAVEDRKNSLQTKILSPDDDKEIAQIHKCLWDLRASRKLISKDNAHAIEQKHYGRIWIRAIDYLYFSIFHPSIKISLCHYDFSKEPFQIFDSIKDSESFMRLYFDDILKDFGKYKGKEVWINTAIINILMQFKQDRLDTYRGISAGLDLLLDIVDYVYDHPDQFPHAFRHKNNNDLNDMIEGVAETLKKPLESKEDVHHLRFCIRPFKGKSFISETE